MRRIVVLVTLFGPACASEVIVHKLDEKEANQIVEVLSEEAQINADKITVDTGREVYFNVSVSAGKALEAIKVLNKYELPRRQDRGYHEVFQEAGMIPTNAEERAKQLAALEGEIERQLKLIDGILDVQVQIVVPEESALRTTREQEPATTASVTIKYMPGPGGAAPLSLPSVQQVVAYGVEKLTPDHVFVAMAAATPGGRRGGEAPAGQGDPRGRTIWRRLPEKQLNAGLFAFIGLASLLGLGFVYNILRLRNVRGRLIRLQGEIAKARRKPTTETSQPAG